MHRPWMKKQPIPRAGLATVIEGGRLLVTAEMVSHATYIELEKPEDGPKCTAVVESIDPECNLAILKPSDPDILKGTAPLSLDSSVKTGSELQILQLEENGSPALTPAKVTTVGVMAYPGDGAAYLTYRTSSTIPQREDSFVIPALHQGKLAGLVMRYEPKSQAADIIPAPLIERFLKESAKPGYNGLARAGLAWQQVRGSTLRQWMGAPDNHQGVYVTWVEPEGPAEKAGLKQGDLLTQVDGCSIDGEGNYPDPAYGKLTFNNLASLRHSPGDLLKATYFRSTGEGKGASHEASITLEGERLSAEVIPSRLDGDRVPYTFLGPLLFQELSHPYLREWGSNWLREAPENLVYLDAFQHELPRDQKHLVILAGLFPSAQTIGYKDLGKRVVVRINDRDIHDLSDVSEAANHPINGFHKIILEGSVGPIYLDASTCSSDEEEVRRHYGIPASKQQSDQ
jgi:hypothetical protein